MSSSEANKAIKATREFRSAYMKHCAAEAKKLMAQEEGLKYTAALSRARKALTQDAFIPMFRPQPEQPAVNNVGGLSDADYEVFNTTVERIVVGRKK